MYNVERSDGTVIVTDAVTGEVIFQGGPDTYLLYSMAGRTFANQVKAFSSDGELLLALANRVRLDRA